MNIVQQITSSPELLALLVVVIRVGLAYQRQLTWPEYRMLHRLKRGTFPILNRIIPGTNLFVNEKGDRSGGEYIKTVDGANRKDVVKLLQRGGRFDGGSLHLINSIKRRKIDGVVQYSTAHVVWSHNDGTQTEAYMFSAPEGGVDVYAHHETGVTDPDGHISDPQTDGDPRGVVKEALDF